MMISVVELVVVVVVVVVPVRVVTFW